MIQQCVQRCGTGLCWHNESHTISLEWGYGDSLCNTRDSCFGKDFNNSIQISPDDTFIEVQLKPQQIQVGDSLNFTLDENMAVYVRGLRPYLGDKKVFLSCNSNASSGSYVVPQKQKSVLIGEKYLTEGAHYFIDNVDMTFRCYHCEVNINDCASNPCRHGTCIDQINGYKCYCKPGFGGPTCGLNLNECISNPCLNGGYCVDEINNYRCDCGHGYQDKVKPTTPAPVTHDLLLHILTEHCHLLKDSVLLQDILVNLTKHISAACKCDFTIHHIIRESVSLSCIDTITGKLTVPVIEDKNFAFDGILCDIRDYVARHKNVVDLAMTSNKSNDGAFEVSRELKTITDDMPPWKQEKYRRDNERITQEKEQMEEKRRKKEEAEKAKLEGIPQWKLPVMQRKEKAKKVQEDGEEEARLKQEEEEEAWLAMPGWWRAVHERKEDSDDAEMTDEQVNKEDEQDNKEDEQVNKEDYNTDNVSDDKHVQQSEDKDDDDDDDDDASDDVFEKDDVTEYAINANGDVVDDTNDNITTIAHEVKENGEIAENNDQQDDNKDQNMEAQAQNFPAKKFLFK
ncbi:hypothetical protein QZH41_005366 [Actinostola sp. cb2023]|nr:hypothetical protein QZH41_005366 [Actinostola sp. cb2023]